VIVADGVGVTRIKFTEVVSDIGVAGSVGITA
jgi:hypothetical protein